MLFAICACDGTDIAVRWGVAGVRRYEDLACWQLANELKVRVYELIDKSGAKHDFDFRDQLKASTSSATSNIAEGFGYYRHKESARYARTAKASLTETHNHLNDGVERRYWTAVEVAELITLADRAIGATMGWIRYLETTETPPPHWKGDTKRRTRKHDHE